MCVCVAGETITSISTFNTINRIIKIINIILNIESTGQSINYLFYIKINTIFQCNDVETLSSKSERFPYHIFSEIDKDHTHTLI